MLVVIPFHAGDKGRALILAKWIRAMGQVEKHKCLLCIDGDPSVGDAVDQEILKTMQECFGSARAYYPNARVKPKEGPMGYARAANAMWQATAWKIFFQESNQGRMQVPWLWLEADAIPTRPTWLNEIEEDYFAAKKPFMGAMGQAQIAMLNGVAVYPANVADYAPLALQAGDCPWDMNAAPQILKYANVSDLFQHIYQIQGEAPTFPKHADKLLQWAAIFHRNKDGTLIEHLKKHGYNKGTGKRDIFTPPEKPVFPQTLTEHAKAKTSSIPPNPPPADDFEIGESVDYAQRMEEFDRTHRQKPRVPNEGERNGDLIWRGGKWHTATHVVAAPKVERAAVMEKYKHPETIIKTEQKPEAGSARYREESPDASAPPPSRDDLVKDAVSVLKSLCTSPHATSQVRKELKRQKVVAK